MKQLFQPFPLAVAAAVLLSRQASADDHPRAVPGDATKVTNGTSTAIVSLGTNAQAHRYRVEWLPKETWTPTFANQWFIEGDSEVSAADGRLRVQHRRQGQMATIWYRRELPKNVLVRFRACAVPPATNNSANLNLFLHARELDGRPLRFGRSGQYKDYQGIPNYIVTFTGGRQAGWSRVRRDPGFSLLHESEARCEVGREYEIAVVYMEGRLRYYLDGQQLHDVLDPDPLPGGHFALRTWDTDGWWSEVEFGRVIEELP